MPIADLHVWRVGKQSYACALSIVTHDETLTAERVRRQLTVHEEIAHATVEIHRCDEVGEARIAGSSGRG